MAPAPDQSFAPGSSGPTLGMLAFFGVGRGERIADLGAGAGYSIEPMANAVGRTGVVYVRHDPRVLTARADAAAVAERAGPLPANVVVMTTEDDAPLSAEATDLDLVTMLFAYHELAPRDRRKFSSAAFRALKPGCFYIVAEHARGDGSGSEERRHLDRIVRADAEAAGFVFVESADLLSSTARSSGADASGPSQYLMKFQKPR
jgi:predicted methyltransferase